MVEANLKGRGAVRRAVDGDPREVLADLGVRPRRRMGQHFLIDARVSARQVAHARIRPSDVVLEIGPGLGVLTRLLAERAKRVVAIEADRRFAEYLRRTLPDVEVIPGDALKVDWPPFDVMASNLPYQISSPLTFRLLEHAFDRAILMYQWEFARRMRAKPVTAEYCRRTVGVYRRAACEILERVPRNAFHPQPKVDSAIVSLVPRPAPFPVSDPGRFDALGDAVVAQRRTQAETGVRLGWQLFAPSREALEAVLPHIPDRTRRVGELSPEDIARIADALRMAKG